MYSQTPHQSVCGRQFRGPTLRGSSSTSSRGVGMYRGYGVRPIPTPPHQANSRQAPATRQSMHPARGMNTTQQVPYPIAHAPTSAHQQAPTMPAAIYVVLAVGGLETQLVRSSCATAGMRVYTIPATSVVVGGGGQTWYGGGYSKIRRECEDMGMMKAIEDICSHKSRRDGGPLVVVAVGVSAGARHLLLNRLGTSVRRVCVVAMGVGDVSPCAELVVPHEIPCWVRSDRTTPPERHVGRQYLRVHPVGGVYWKEFCEFSRAHCFSLDTVTASNYRNDAKSIYPQGVEGAPDYETTLLDIDVPVRGTSCILWPAHGRLFIWIPGQGSLVDVPIDAGAYDILHYRYLGFAAKLWHSHMDGFAVVRSHSEIVIISSVCVYIYGFVGVHMATPQMPSPESVLTDLKERLRVTVESTTVTRYYMHDTTSDAMGISARLILCLPRFRLSGTVPTVQGSVPGVGSTHPFPSEISEFNTYTVHSAPREVVRREPPIQLMPRTDTPGHRVW